MAITLFRKDNFEGDSHVVSADIADLKDTLVKHAASSMAMTSASDSVLLFKNRNYNGDVMFRSVVREISKLSSRSKGGKTGFGDVVASARRTPFTVNLFVNIVAMDDGSFPGFPDFPTFLSDTLAVANGIWNPFLIQLNAPQVIVRRSSKFHDMRSELYPLLWKDWQMPAHANVYFVGSLFKAGGICAPIGWGKGAVVECGAFPDLPRAGDTLAHELGHYFGIKHEDDSQNLMTKSAMSAGVLRDDQVEEVHSALTKHIGRTSLRME